MDKPIGIIGAMDVEIRMLLSQMTIEKEEEISSLRFYTGSIAGVLCVVSKCGPGKVNAAVCAQTMILRYAPRLVLNSGVAGGIAPELAIGDIVVANACVQHDSDTTALGDPPGFISGLELVKIPCDAHAAALLAKAGETVYGAAHTGVIATGDIFLNSKPRGEELHRLYGALACEMEGGSIAHVCYMNSVPAAVLRTISDKGDGDSDMDFPAFARMAAEKLQTLLLAALPSLAAAA